jgi:hypothetical protein
MFGVLGWVDCLGECIIRVLNRSGSSQMRNRVSCSYTTTPTAFPRSRITIQLTAATSLPPSEMFGIFKQSSLVKTKAQNSSLHPSHHFTNTPHQTQSYTTLNAISNSPPFLPTLLSLKENISFPSLTANHPLKQLNSLQSQSKHHVLKHLLLLIPSLHALHTLEDLEGGGFLILHKSHNVFPGSGMLAIWNGCLLGDVGRLVRVLRNPDTGCFLVGVVVSWRSEGADGVESLFSGFMFRSRGGPRIGRCVEGRALPDERVRFCGGTEESEVIL